MKPLNAELDLLVEIEEHALHPDVRVYQIALELQGLHGKELKAKLGEIEWRRRNS